MNLFAKANQGLNLTPGERAVLKLIEGFFIAGLASLAPVVARLAAQQNINWSDELRIVLVTFTVAVLFAISKYFKAQGDAPLATAADALAQEVTNRGGLNDVKQPIVAPVAPAAPAAPTSAPSSAAPSSPAASA